MFISHLRLSSSIAAASLGVATLAPAAILDMDMEAARGGGNGGVHGSLSPQQIELLDRFFSGTYNALRGLNAGRGAGADGCRDELRAAVDTRALLRHYLELIPAAAATHEIVRDEVVAHDVCSDNPRIIPLIRDTFLASFANENCLGAERSEALAGALNAAFEYVSPELLGSIGDPAAAELNELARWQGTLPDRLNLLTNAIAQHVFGNVHCGDSITLSSEPFTSKRGTVSFATTYSHWPFDRVDERELDSGSDLRSSRLVLHGDMSLTDTLQLGVSVPVHVVADEPTGFAPDRKAGIGDVRFRLKWWTSQWLRLRAAPRAADQGRTGPVFHWGLGGELRAETGDVDGDTGHGSSYLMADARASLEFRGNGSLAPRLHALVGRRWELDGDGDDKNPSRDPGSYEVVGGVVFNVDPWRGRERGVLESPRQPDRSLGFWIDIAGSLYDEAEGVAGSGAEAWELRAGLGLLNVTQRDSARALRQSLSFEVHRRLDEDGLWSDPMSVQLQYHIQK